jgi:lysozyme
MNLNSEGMKILIDSEGIYLQPYLDPKKIPTIGIGTIVYPNGKRVSMSDRTITLEEAHEYLNYELKEKAATIQNWINNNKLSLTGNQFSALLCFAYNLGCGPIIDKDRSLSQAILNKGDVRAAFMLYTKISVWYGKKELKGLVIRREKEANLYLAEEV